MTSSPNLDAPDDLEPALDDAGESRLARWIGPLILLAAVAAAGSLPAAFGYGPFGYRLLTSDRVSVHVLNLSGGDVDVELPFQRRTVVRGGTLETLETLEGPIEIVTWDETLQEIDRFTVEATGPMLYDVGGTRCFAVFDVTNLYGGRGGEPIRFVEGVRHRKTYTFRADTVLLPRRTPPDVATGTVHWIEPVDCDSLGEDGRDELLMWAEYRLRLRRERFEENRRRLP